jgi:hypothetical protein
MTMAKGYAGKRKGGGSKGSTSPRNQMSHNPHAGGTQGQPQGSKMYSNQDGGGALGQPHGSNVCMKPRTGTQGQEKAEG